MTENNKGAQRFNPGDLVYLTRSLVEEPYELLTVLWKIKPEEDEPEDIPKYLTRTSSHSKKVVFACEVIAAEQPLGKCPSCGYIHHK